MINVSKPTFLFFTIILLKITIIYYVVNGNWSFFEHPVYKPSERFNNKSIFLISRTYANLQNGRDLTSRTNPNWFWLSDKLNRINENMIYNKFNIKEVSQQERVNVILIVSSAPARFDRRKAIRETWWRDCKTNGKLSILCVFLTDQKDKKTEIGIRLLNEQSKNADLFFQKLEGGHDFGKRFLYHLIWAMQKIKFDYFMRIDDDYFFCMKRFINEVPMPPKSLYHWGWVHCIENIVRPEESIILLSRDIVENFVGQNPDKMKCHRWADQMLGVWNEDLELPKFYHHDPRLHHDPPAQYVKKFKDEKNICEKYIGVHGAYPPQMRLFWKNRGNFVGKRGKTFDDYAAECHFPSVMKWNIFTPLWRAEPKLCKANPDWGGSHGTTYIGRQENLYADNTFTPTTLLCRQHFYVENILNFYADNILRGQHLFADNILTYFD